MKLTSGHRREFLEQEANSDIRAVIGRLPFRLAKTMPHIPHEYTVRSPEIEADYFALFNAIQTQGTFGRYKGRKKRYLYPGDGFKYWSMTTSQWHSHVLNRMRIEDDLPRLRAEGQV
jgi:hypothetical protein